MSIKEIEVVNRLGLHARAATKLVQLCTRFESEITLVKDGKKANGKSIMAVMTLAATQGAVLTVETIGADDQQALAAIEDLFADRFGEAV
ncbi:MAG: HPr family phosphocarrier protein [Pseudomonadota bacterium]